MRLKVKDSTEFAPLDQSQQLAHRRKEAFVGADAQHRAGSTAGFDRAHRLVLRQGQRLLTEDRLSCVCDGDDLLTMQRMRRRQHDRVNGPIGEHRFELAGHGEPVTVG